jgi:hypothetical protein
MPMKNLEQIRAARALRFWHRPANGETAPGAAPAEIEAAQRLPVLLLKHGLLATLALAKSQGDQSALGKLMIEIGGFLCGNERRVLPPWPPRRPGEGALDPLIRLLTEGDAANSQRLQQATAEALAYGSYLRRFAPLPIPESK